MMKVEIENKLLAAAAAAVKGLASRDAASLFSNVRLDAAGGHLSVTATDGSVQAEYREECAIAETGAVTVPAAAFAAFAGAMPDGSIRVEAAGVQLRMDGGGVSFSVAAGDGGNYPQMAGPADGAAAVHVPAATLREMLRKTQYAAAPATSGRGALRGILTTLEHGVLGMTATDGKRLSHVEFDVGDGSAETAAAAFSAVLPLRAAGLLVELLGKEGGEVLAEFDKRAFRVTGGAWAVTGKVLEAEYPQWRQVVPEPEHTAVIDRAAFLAAIGRVALVVDKGDAVAVTVRDGEARVESASSTAAAQATVAGCTVEDGASVRFNICPSLLADALGSVDDDTVRMGFLDRPGTALKFECAQPWLAVVMPMCAS